MGPVCLISQGRFKEPVRPCFRVNAILLLCANDNAIPGANDDNIIICSVHFMSHGQHKTTGGVASIQRRLTADDYAVL